MNELVTRAGDFDFTRTPDSSGYSNTGTLKGGASFPPKNNGALGKAVVFDGVSGRVEVPHAASLNPVNALALEMRVRPASAADCDGNNNYRVLLQKGTTLDGSYSLVLEDDGSFSARVRVAGGQNYALHSPTPLPTGQWSRVAVQYDAATGTFTAYVDGQETARQAFPPALLEGLPDLLFLAGRGVRSACPNGDGSFHGELDEVLLSRTLRFGLPPDAGTDSDGGTGGDDAGVHGGDVTEPDAGSGGGVPADAGAGGSVGGDAGTGGQADAGRDAGRPRNGGGVAASAGGCTSAGNSLLPLAAGVLLASAARRRRR
jgi:hypothetical protein